MRPPERLISPQAVAKAAKALNYVYGLSPSARRVGLPCWTTSMCYTARCDPSEERLAAMLHISDSGRAEWQV